MQMTLLRDGMKHLNVHHFVRMSTLLEREVQTKAVIEELMGALERKQGVWDSELSKTRVLTITGVKGCGKTMFMRHLAGGQAGGKAQQGLVESSRVGGKAVVVSNSAIVHMKGRQGEGLLRSFGVLLLADNRVPRESAEAIASFDEAILLMREELGLTTTEPLTVLVDIMLLNHQLEDLIIYLKQYQDKTMPPSQETLEKMSEEDRKALPPPVLFVFSALTAQPMAEHATASGRAVEVLNLDCFSDDEAAFKLLPEGIRECIKEHGALQALYKSLGGHPRAITEGLALIPVRQLRAAVTSATEYARVESEIIITCKLNLLSDLPTELSKCIPLWMSFNFDAECNREHKERMRLLGYLQRKDGTEVLMPLLLRHYALSWGDDPLKVALRACYSADNDLWKGANEKRAETLLLSWEMVLKLANPDGATRGVFFAGAHTKDPAFLNDVLTWPRPAMKYVKSLASIPDLKAGTTLVSANATEPGVEYVTTFACGDKKQEAALVQVKFGVTNPGWGKMQEGMQNSPARKAVDKLQVACSHIVYTTFASAPPMDERSERFLYFNHEGLKAFTAKLGPLKLHFAKRMSLLAPKGRSNKNTTHTHTSSPTSQSFSPSLVPFLASPPSERGRSSTRAPTSVRR